VQEPPQQSRDAGLELWERRPPQDGPLQEQRQVRPPRRVRRSGATKAALSSARRSAWAAKQFELFPSSVALSQLRAREVLRPAAD
jgi:hypothetical protein